MGLTEVKSDLFKKLDALSESKFYETYGIILNFLNKETQTNDWESLTTEQQEAIYLGLNQLNNGEGKNHEEVMFSIRNKYLNG